ncbi:MAG: segregation/condensation protein A [Myxococcales bacterium]|nr:segregation/condensation protein A [Myxococcales bacterium]
MQTQGFESAEGSVRSLFEGTAGYAVKVPVFEGPLDLLLHLIRMNEVEITDIPVASISAQYLEYLEVIEELNLDVAGEYLVMAATLAWIKSRMLLPPDGVEDGIEGPDPREELVARLLEYQRFKEVAKELGESTWLGRDVFRAVGPVLEAPAEAMREIEVGLFELVEAYRTVLTTVRHTGKAHEIEAETITVRQCMLDIMDAMQARESIEFDQIVLGPAAAAPTISVLVASFLAILELTRLGVLRVYQSVTEASVPVGPIHLRRVIDPDDRAWTEQLADIL